MDYISAQIHQYAWDRKRNALIIKMVNLPRRPYGNENHPQNENPLGNNDTNHNNNHSNDNNHVNNNENSVSNMHNVVPNNAYNPISPPVPSIDSSTEPILPLRNDRANNNDSNSILRRRPNNNNNSSNNRNDSNDTTTTNNNNNDEFNASKWAYKQAKNILRKYNLSILLNDASVKARMKEWLDTSDVIEKMNRMNDLTDQHQLNQFLYNERILVNEQSSSSDNGNERDNDQDSTHSQQNQQHAQFNLESNTTHTFNAYDPPMRSSHHQQHIPSPNVHRTHQQGINHNHTRHSCQRRPDIASPNVIQHQSINHNHTRRRSRHEQPDIASLNGIQHHRLNERRRLHQQTVISLPEMPSDANYIPFPTPQPMHSNHIDHPPNVSNSDISQPTTGSASNNAKFTNLIPKRFQWNQLNTGQSYLKTSISVYTCA